MLTAILGELNNGGSFWLPRQASTVARDVDGLFYGVYYMSVFFFVLITLLLVTFIIKYRHREDGKPHEPAAGHSTALELTWTIIPTILLLVIFYVGFRGFVNMAVEPPNAYEIGVRGKTWNWSYTYEQQYPSSDGMMHVPVNTPIRLILSSDDVIHSFFIPDFRVKKDVVPGRYNRLWFQATKVGTYDVTCAEYCGQNHSVMTSKVVVEELPDFERWLQNTKDPYKTHPPLEVGKILFETRGCMGCHTNDGRANIGPTLKDLFGGKAHIKGQGEITVDENYIHESILYPQAKIVEGFPTPSPMPSFLGQLSDRDIDSIIGYLKSISVHFKGDLSPYKKLLPPGDAKPAAPGPAAKPAGAAAAPPPAGAGASAPSPVAAASPNQAMQAWSSHHVR